MSKDGVIVTKDRTGDLVKMINLLSKKDILVGIPSTATERNAKGTPANNALIGYVMENGSPKKNIPARPHLVPGVREAEPKFLPHLKKAAEAALQGNGAEVDRRLHMAGQVAVNSVKAKINSNIPPVLADATLAARKRRGVTRENTLVDTGNYRDSTTYVVRQK